MAPVIRVVHHLACSGGTVISRCLAAMQGVALLSEQHPSMGMQRRTSALKQAQIAYNLLSEQDLHDCFLGQIELIHQRAHAAGMTLVVRDHTNADFNAPSFSAFTTADVLARRFRVVSVVTVRHPVDAWLGMTEQGWMPHTIEVFAQRFLTFARLAARAGFVRYEDFCADPHSALRRICAAIEVPFDPAYAERMDSVTHLTGASGRQSASIAPRPRRPVDARTLERFRSAPGMLESLELLGYEGVESSACEPVTTTC
jgi:hypothetical protein